MNSVLFPKIDQVFSFKKNTGKKLTEKSGNLVSPEKWKPWFY